MVKHAIYLRKLELRQRPRQSVRPPDLPLHIMENKAPELSFYQYLIQTIGGESGWGNQSNELGTCQFTSSAHRLIVVYLSGNPCGLAELIQLNSQTVEIKHFGLIPSARHQKIGKYFFNWILHHCWSDTLDKMTLTHSDWDHPAAKAIFLRSGFVLSEEYIVQRSMPASFVPPLWS